MKAIIAGAGRVGLAVASVVTRGGSALIMETDTAQAEAVQNIPGVSVLRDDASNPKELRLAIERFNPEVVIAAVDRDSTNIYICSTVKHIRPQIRTIATVKNNDYLGDSDIPSVDALIAPRNIAAVRVAMCTLVENMISFSEIRSFGLCQAVFRIERGQKIAGQNVMNIPVSNGQIVAIYRGGRTITDTYPEQIHTDDRILVVGKEEMLRRFNDDVGVERAVRNITIIGASDLGIQVAGIILGSPGRHAVKVIDRDLALCNKAARALRGAIIVQGPVSDPVFLRSENVDRSDAVLALSDAEDTNLLICMNSQRFGVPKIISQYTGDDYGDLLRYSGVEGALGYNSVIVNETSFNINSAEQASDSAFVFDNSDEVIFSFAVDKGLRICNRYVGDVYLPDGTCVVAVMRNGKAVFPDLTTRFMQGDRVVMYTQKYDASKISRLIGRPFTGM